MRSLTYGSYSELLYSMPFNGPALANTVTRSLLSTPASTTSSAPFKIPAGFFNPGAGIGQAIRVVARGIMSTTGTPTFTFAAALDPTQGTFGTNLASTGAFTTASGLASALWEAEFECTCQSLGTSGVLTVAGVLTIGAAANAATTAATAYMIGTASDVLINTNVDNYLELWGTWGTASASNTATLYQYMVHGLN